MKDILRSTVLVGIFAIPFLPLIVSNTLFFPFITGKNFAFRIIVEVIFAAWALLALMDAAYRPRFSWILGGFVWFVVVIFAADIFGVSPHKSLWSNYERMEGFVTLFHLFLYFVVLGASLTTEKLWKAFLNTSIAVAVLMSMYAFGQIFGFISIEQSDVRVDARLGNAAYLAIYMLFHVYLAVYVLVITKNRNLKILYGLLSLVFVYVLVETGTRGTAIALASSALLTVAYIALFERENKLMRKVAIAGLGVVVAVVLGLSAAKNTAFIQSHSNVARLTTISMGEAQTRFTIWKLAIEGVKERPILGWGQENFNYVFNKYYKASLYGQEPWFDRVHDIVFDWLIAGGIVGFLSYVFVLASSAYYAAVRPLYTKYKDTFTVTERGILLGVLAGYVVHNIFVFDNLISYTLFAAVIALIHARTVANEKPIFEGVIEDTILTNIAMPTVGALAIAIIYFVNIPSIQAAGDLINAFQAPSPEAQYAAFDTALTRGSFGQQEIREQLTRITQSVAQDPQFAAKLQQLYKNLPPAEQTKKIADLRNTFLSRTESELALQVKETPNDVRVLVFQASFYRVMGKPDIAEKILDRAVALSPEKQQTHFELGLSLFQQQKYPEAFNRFKIAYELEPKNDQARMLYAAAAIYTRDVKTRDMLITPAYRSQYVSNDFVIRALYDTKQFPELISLLNERIKLQPNDPQMRVSLAAVLREAGLTKEAIAVLQKAIVDFPDFKPQGEQYIAQLQKDTTPKK